MRSTMTQPDSATLLFEFPQPAPRGLPETTLRLRLEALACGAVRVTRTLREGFLPCQTPVVVNRAPGSWELLPCTDAYLARTGDLLVRVDPEEGAVRFLDAQGRTLLQERESQPCILQEKPVMKNIFHKNAAIRYRESVDGVRASTEDYETYVDRQAYTCKLSLRLDADEGLYGLGSHEEGYGNLRGRMRELYQHNMKAVVPVLVSTKGWGMLFDLGCLMIFHDDAEGTYLWADCADEMDYYFMAGGYPNVMKTYAALTGPTPLLPRYAFGYVQSKERYKDAQELISVVKEYRQRQVPLDMIVLDWRSWPGDLWGFKIFDPDRFPDPGAMTEKLHQLGAKMMISIWPSMQGDANENRAEMLANDCMLGNGTIYNAFDSKARELYWQQAYEGLFRYGVDAWWCDCSEPFESDWHGRIKPEPFERVRLNTEESKKYLDPAQINLYSLYHAQGIYQGQRSVTDRKRVVNLTRSSYAGQHRYATIVWSGDVSSSWEVLRRQVPEGLNYCATGENYWTTDAGGFFPMGHGGAWFGAGDFNDGVNDLGFRELYVRWLQFSAFLPMMRAHGTGTPREIWQFGEKGDPWYDAIEKIICFRVRLLPYLYTLAAQCTSDGMPMLRVPALVFPGDAALRQHTDQMMLGNDLLVQPVTRPMTYGPGSQEISPYNDQVSVYLPQGSLWYAWESACPLEGGQTLCVHAPLDIVPLFVRAGAVIPTGPVMQYADEIEHPPLLLTIYPGSDGAFTLYDDEGDGYGYENGVQARIPFVWDDGARRLTIGPRSGSYPGMAPSRQLTVRLMGGKEVTLQYTGTEQVVDL